MTLSSSFRAIAFTPLALLPMALTSVSLNRIAIPFSVATRSCDVPSVSLTQTSSSSSSMSMAIRPPFRLEWNSAADVLLMIPFLVIITRYIPSSPSSGIRIIEVTFSSCTNGSRLLIFIPFEVLEPSGII